MRKIKVGYQLDFRNPPGSSIPSPELYREMLGQVEAAEAFGFDSIWLTEHHFTDDGYLPAMMPAAAAIAARTQRITIGTFVLLAPMQHPLRLAEDAAVVDVISNGRLRLGIGLGYRAEEFAGFGVPRAERLGRTLETLEILRRAWTGERFSFEGKYFKFADVRILPRPASRPYPELLWGAGTAKAIRRAAKLDLGFACVGGRREIGIYLDALKAEERDPSRYSIINSRVVYVADSEAEAWNDTRDALMYQAELYAKWLSASSGADPSQRADSPRSGATQTHQYSGAARFCAPPSGRDCRFRSDDRAERCDAASGPRSGARAALARTLRPRNSPGDEVTCRNRGGRSGANLLDPGGEPSIRSRRFRARAPRAQAPRESSQPDDYTNPCEDSRPALLLPVWRSSISPARTKSVRRPFLRSCAIDRSHARG